MASPPASATAGTASDLGLRPARTALGVLAAAATPAAVGLACGLSPLAAASVAGASAAALLTAFRLCLGALRRDLVAPLQEVTQGLEQLRNRGQTSRLPEHGAPILQPLLRRFNLACTSVEEREQLSRANLMSVEVAFDRVHSVLQSLREGVLVVDVDGRVVLANRSARIVVRSDAGAIEGRYLTDLVDGDLKRSIDSAMAQVDGGDGEEVRSTDIVHGHRFFDLTVVQVQSTRPDHDFGKVIVLVDVTKNHELNRLKDDLISSISHELRTPLTNMCSSSEILTTMDPGQEADWREFAQILNVESHRLKSLVDDVMEYSQLETGNLQWNREPADVHQIASNAVAMTRAAATARNLQISIGREGDCRAASVDQQRLTEVICRVLDNAMKFTPAGGRIHVAISSRDELLDVTIADSGIGIAPEDRQRVFERFSQIGDIMTDKPKGAGLGLAICQRIIDAMGGTMWCEESPLGGAQVRFVLPHAEVRA